VVERDCKHILQALLICNNCGLSLTAESFVLHACSTRKFAFHAITGAASFGVTLVLARLRLAADLQPLVCCGKPAIFLQPLVCMFFFAHLIFQVLAPYLLFSVRSIHVLFTKLTLGGGCMELLPAGGQPSWFGCVGATHSLSLLQCRISRRPVV